jgi:Na+/H+ antiporter NhaD/arsenite permease-like protein
LPDLDTRARKPELCAILCLFILVLAVASPALGSVLHSTAVAAPSATEASGSSSSIGAELPLSSIGPFAGILLSIAFFPLFAPHWWHRHFPKVSLFWAAAFAIPAVVIYGHRAVDAILHVYLLEYIPFIALLWALFTIAGGIHVRGTLRGSPGSNTVLIIVGTAIASWVGTTGASMILIRPLLRANSWRRHKVHTVVFFIFLVSNIGGTLTPLGDPPLFLGFLLGVPFFWTMHLLPEMTFMALPLLAIYYFLDRRLHGREKEGPPETESQPIRIDGLHNIALLLGVVVIVFISGIWHPGSVTIMGIHVATESLVRDGVMVLLGIASLLTTSKMIHKANEFSWFPIKEVAILFAGIFMTITSPILILQAGSEGAFHALIDFLKSPVHYFWVTGALSSFLDNAPSYLTLFSSLLGKFFADLPVKDGVNGVIAEQSLYLVCISLGAVFWGALTYLGNAPNFMVKSIAEEAGVKMPSFFGFMFKFSIPLLIPLFVLLSLVFF